MEPGRRKQDLTHGIVATIMALDRCIRNQGQQGSVYDERPLIVF